MPPRENATLHEGPKVLKRDTIDRHRALVSLMEELEAVDWYDQRVDATADRELRAILAHNLDEEKEHFSMLLERIRRHEPAFDRELRSYLFREGSIADAERAETAASGRPSPTWALSLGRTVLSPVTGIFSDARQAERGVHELVQHDFEPDQISPPRNDAKCRENTGELHQIGPLCGTNRSTMAL